MALFTPMAYWGGVPAFSPTNIPNLAGWYDASDTGSYIKSGTTIIGIRSQDTYGDDLDVQAGSNPTAGATQNGLDTLYFNGSTYLENSNTDPLVSSTGTHFAVGIFYPQNIDNDKDSLWSIDSSRDYAVSAADNSRWYGELDLGNGVGNDGIIGPFNNTNKENSWIIVTVVFTKIPSTNTIWFFINSSTGNNSSTTYLSNLRTNQKLRLMANRTGNRKTPGRFAELLLFDGDCGISGNIYSYRYQAEGYLAWKWGLQGNLPSNHPYKNSPPT